MNRHLYASTYVRKVKLLEDGEELDEDKGTLFKLGFLLKDTVDVMGEGAARRQVIMSQCCYEQSFVSIYSTELNDMNRLKEVVYQSLHNDMGMDEQLAQISKGLVANVIKEDIAESNRQINHSMYSTIEMEIEVSMFIKKNDTSDRPSGTHGYSELKQRIENENCSICQEMYSDDKDIVVTTCHHVYHYKCIFQWLEGEKLRLPSLSI